MNKDIFELTKEQQRAFNRLKKAYNDCEKLGIFFINNYGSLQAVDKKYISGYRDDGYYGDSISEVSNLEIGEPYNSFSIANEWTDDKHYYILTKKGYKLYHGIED